MKKEGNKKMIRNMNSGYHGYSMSNRAVTAYESGEKPLSKWRKSDILDELEDLGKDSSRLKKYSLNTLKKYFLKRSSWHHTSGYLNKTVFYEVKDIDVSYEKLDEIEKEMKEHVSNSSDDVEKVLIRYGIWEGTRKHPKLIEKEEYALLKGNWAYLKDGSKKKMSGKHVQIKERYKRAPKGTACIFKEIKKTMKF